MRHDTEIWHDQVGTNRTRVPKCSPDLEDGLPFQLASSIRAVAEKALLAMGDVLLKGPV
jgi:hypothetical protein